MRLLTQLKKIVRDRDEVKIQEFVDMVQAAEVKGSYYGNDLHFFRLASGGNEIIGNNMLFKFGYLQAMQDMGKECNEVVPAEENILSRNEKHLVEIYRRLPEEGKYILRENADTLLSVEFSNIQN